MGEQKADDDSQVLYPDATITIDGRDIEVREFRYEEGLRAAAIARPIITAMRDMLPENDSEIDLTALEQIMGDNAQAWMELIALSTGQDVDWLRSLSDRDGLNLSILFWEVNAPFFTRRLVLAAASEQEASRSPSPKSSQNLSPPDTAETTKKSANA